MQSAAHLRSVGDETDFQFNAEVYRRDGFGDHPAFAGIVAELDQRLVGYLLYTFGYDTDRALRYLFVIDLLSRNPALVRHRQSLDGPSRRDLPRSGRR
ncbi:MAG: hypothetical protein U0401_24715 [Anaerolineae bacterium]